MKTIIAFAAGVLLTSTLSFAKSTEESSSKASLSVITTGSDLVKVSYKSLKSSNVVVTIKDENGQVVFTEKIMNSDAFVRPYNFKSLPDGNYVVQIEDADGKKIETVMHGTLWSPAPVSISKIDVADSRYKINGTFLTEERINIDILDSKGNTLYQDTRIVKGNFSQTFNLQNVVGSFSIKVSDANGTLKIFTK